MVGVQVNELSIRLGCFLAMLIAMAIWELLLPRRSLVARKPWRWVSNLSLVVINAGLARVVIPMTGVAAALVAETRGWGLLHLVEWPRWIELILAVVAFDLAIYLQHVMFHAVPLLWRLHMVHHADLDFDVTTGLRFHSLEILLSALIRLGVVLVLGAAVAAVVAIEVLLNATSMFNHSNVRMPGWLDQHLRWLVVTPDMHRVHHSVVHREMNSNFGFSLPWWDYLLHTYRSKPQAGHEAMEIGLAEFPDEWQVDRLPGMLILPFVSRPADSMFESDSAAGQSQMPRDSIRGVSTTGIGSGTGD